MAMYHGQQPMHLGSIACYRKWGHEHPVVPGEPIIEAQMVVIHMRFCQVMLQRGCYVVGVTSLFSIPLRTQYIWKCTPEIKILGHVHLLEYIHEPIFLGNSFYAVVVADWENFGAFTMIYVVSA